MLDFFHLLFQFSGFSDQIGLVSFILAVEFRHIQSNTLTANVPTFLKHFEALLLERQELFVI
jgi:hypothetical protein